MSKSHATPASMAAALVMTARMRKRWSHSEDLADQEKSVELTRRLGEPYLAHALGHHDIVRRFGRFPHRNPILGRAMTAEEQRFLDEGGFSG